MIGSPSRECIYQRVPAYTVPTAPLISLSSAGESGSSGDTSSKIADANDDLAEPSFCVRVKPPNPDIVQTVVRTIAFTTALKGLRFITSTTGRKRVAVFFQVSPGSHAGTYFTAVPSRWLAQIMNTTGRQDAHVGERSRPSWSLGCLRETCHQAPSLSCVCSRHRGMSLYDRIRSQAWSPPRSYKTTVSTRIHYAPTMIAHRLM